MSTALPRPEIASRTALLVLGMHRSGTSALTRTLNLLGADLPHGLIPASTSSNPSGHWESREIQELNDRILEALGARWDDWHPIDAKTLPADAAASFHRRAAEILERDFAQSPLFVLKDPRMCRLLPLWRTALAQFGADIRCALIWRAPADVASSLARRNGFDDAKSQLVWLRHVLDAERDSRGLRRTVVAYEELVADWRSLARRLADELALTWPQQAQAEHGVDAFIKPPAIPESSARATRPNGVWVDEAVRLLRATTAKGASLDTASAGFDRISAEFDRAHDAFRGALDSGRTASAAAIRLEQTLGLKEQYIHALENAARIRDSQLLLGNSQAEQADARIGELETHLNACRAGHSTEGARARAQQLRLLRERRALAVAHLSRISTFPPRRGPQRKLTMRERMRLHGQAKRLLATGLFDQTWYLQASPDVLIAGLSPLWHWLLGGWREGRSPNPLFDTGWYLETYPDAAESGLDPLTHYLEHAADRRLRFSPLLCPDWYLQRYPDVRNNGIDPAIHWLVHGRRESRAPSAWFDPRWYLEENPDVADSEIPALEHYLLAGGLEGRDPCPGFSSRWYLASYRDVTGNPLMHYLKHGIAERRWPLPRPPAYRPGQTLDGVFDPHSSFSIALGVPDHIEAYALAIAGAGEQGRFSVIMPTWNRREPLMAAIDSVIAQSYPDWELLVCDDGSTDGTEEAVHRRYAEKIEAGRIRYLSLPHIGVSAARNAGLRAAVGTWIAYLDSDNTWHPHYLLLMAAGYAEQPRHRAAYACVRVHDEAANKQYVRHHPFHFGRLLAHNYIDLNVFTHHRSLFEQLGGFDEALRRLVDWDLILRFTRLYRPLLLPHVLCDYRIAETLQNISLIEALGENERIIRRKHAPLAPSTGAMPLRLACVLPGRSPSASARARLDELCRMAIDVRAYFPAGGQEETEESAGLCITGVAGDEQLAEALAKDQRNWIHCIDPTPDTLSMVTSAAERAITAYSIEAAGLGDTSEELRSALRHAIDNDLCATLLVDGAGVHTRASLPGGKLLLAAPGGCTQALLDCCARPALDIFTVTNLQAADGADADAVERSIRSLLTRTASPMVLTIVDDGSVAAGIERLAAIARNDSRVRLITSTAGQGFANCANLALSLAESDYVIHLAGVGGYVLRDGWEQACLQAMRTRPDWAMMVPPPNAGSMPTWRALRHRPWFSHCREADYARRRATRPVAYAQAGLFVLRREIAVREGGFNELVPEAYCHLEYGHFLESRGHLIGHFGGLHAVPAGDNPALDPRLDESVLVISGATSDAIALAECVSREQWRRCNVCGWHGTSTLHADGVGFDCPQCASSPRDRATLRWLCSSQAAASRSTLDARGLGPAVRRRLEAVLLLRDGPSEITPPMPIPGTSSHALGLAPSLVTGEAVWP
jgi:GT2 family glycosyltransferase